MCFFVIFFIRDFYVELTYNSVLDLSIRKRNNGNLGAFFRRSVAIFVSCCGGIWGWSKSRWGEWAWLFHAQPLGDRYEPTRQFGAALSRARAETRLPPDSRSGERGSVFAFDDLRDIQSHHHCDFSMSSWKSARPAGNCRTGSSRERRISSHGDLRTSIPEVLMVKWRAERDTLVAFLFDKPKLFTSPPNSVPASEWTRMGRNLETEALPDEFGLFEVDDDPGRLPRFSCISPASSFRHRTSALRTDNFKHGESIPLTDPLKESHFDGVITKALLQGLFLTVPNTTRLKSG